MDRKRRLKKGFTLIEVMVTAAILVAVIITLLRSFISCSKLSEISGNMTFAMSEAETKLEEIRNHDYDSIDGDYDETTFDLTDVQGKGFIYIDSSNPDLLEMEIAVCWRNKDGRVIGEDVNLDGILTESEDIIVDNDKVDSPAVTLVGLIARR